MSESHTHLLAGWVQLAVRKAHSVSMVNSAWPIPNHPLMYPLSEDGGPNLPWLLPLCHHPQTTPLPPLPITKSCWVHLKAHELVPPFSSCGHCPASNLHGLSPRLLKYPHNRSPCLQPCHLSDQNLWKMRTEYAIPSFPLTQRQVPDPRTTARTARSSTTSLTSLPWSLFSQQEWWRS